MKAKIFILNFTFITLVFCLSVSAQISNTETKLFDQDGLSFSYPSNWELSDQSTPEMQQLKLSLPKTSTLIYITSPRSLVTTEEQFYEAQETITNQFAENIRRIFAVTDHSTFLKEENVCSKVDRQIRVRTLIYGSYQNRPGTAEIYSAVKQYRFVNVVFVRNDKDNERMYPVWQKISDTLEIVTPNTKNLPALTTYNNISGGVLNGKAISLPRPFYPNGVRQRGVVSVAVKVTIDETGKVITARAQPGEVERIFIPIAEQAAKEARFSPSYLCGEAVRVTGIIIYNFDSRRKRK